MGLLYDFATRIFAILMFDITACLFRIINLKSNYSHNHYVKPISKLIRIVQYKWYASYSNYTSLNVIKKMIVTGKKNPLKSNHCPKFKCIDVDISQPNKSNLNSTISTLWNCLMHQISNQIGQPCGIHIPLLLCPSNPICLEKMIRLMPKSKLNSSAWCVFLSSTHMKSYMFSILEVSRSNPPSLL